MPKRRRLLTPIKKKPAKAMNDDDRDTQDANTPRGRLKGALLDALDPIGEDSDTSLEQSPLKRERSEIREHRKERRYSSEDDRAQQRQSPQRQPFVLKMFDRNVDLSQFEEDSPLYPICRAWIANQPKANYKKFGKKYRDPLPTLDSVELPGPEGPLVSRIPQLLPEQEMRSKDNINLDYRSAPPPSREQLLALHAARWQAVRGAWLAQAARVHRRYDQTQQLLNRINVNAI